MDAHIRFVLLTGVSKFSKIGVFSGLNNLEDLTMSASASALVGVTANEAQLYGQPYLQTWPPRRDERWHS